MSLPKVCRSGKLIALASNLAFIFAIFAIFAVAGTLLPAAAFADDLSDCAQTSDLPRVIVGCTNLISTPAALHDHTAIAYRNRSSAYAALGDFERAEQDYQHAIALNPRYLNSLRPDDPFGHPLFQIGSPEP